MRIISVPCLRLRIFTRAKTQVTTDIIVLFEPTLLIHRTPGLGQTRNHMPCNNPQAAEGMATGDRPIRRPLLQLWDNVVDGVASLPGKRAV